MSKLAVETSHSLRFLNDFLQTAEDIHDHSIKLVFDLNNIKKYDNTYAKQLRETSKRLGEDIDDAINSLILDFQIVSIELSDIISNKNSEEVIYELIKYDRYLDKISDFLKDDLLRTINDVERRKTTCVVKKDFVKAVVYNKILTPLYRLKEMCTRIKKRLEILTNKK